MNISWKNEVEKRKDALLKDTCNLIMIKSVLDDQANSVAAPFGEGINQALEFMLDLGNNSGFETKNIEGYAGHIQCGSGEELIGVLGHIDVVPEGDGWSTDPYGAEILEGKIYGRGAIDDKGPTMAAFYGMKIIKELGLPLSKRVRLIIGADEESQWRCVDRYFQVEEMPTMGFAPDADFPIINAEKGICDMELVFQNIGNDISPLKAFQAGRRFNMVPDLATATVKVDQPEEVIKNYKQYLDETKLHGEATYNGDDVSFTLEGLSAHGMEPDKGKNAGIFLANFLTTLNLKGNAGEFLAFITKYFYKDSRGRTLGLNYEDKQTGPLTINVGKINFSSDSARVGLNLRYPVTYDFDKGLNHLEEMIREKGIVVDLKTHARPHYVNAEHPLIQTLQEVYTRQTGETATLLSTGGGTYARSLNAGVAFGALFPGRPELAHQKDEYIDIEDLLKATALYAEAIYELAK
ncbi:dipeptidase PepV [Anaerobacillus alkaliphilus]|uniref:Dipeptidase PepV n=1 Tax=Anaerobacillus alkaliphilus TaxID=1548597 RepID=A0A4Q0VR01_9BACI|nr:dipeptidase PepV [Anaerobacillus alkaliphilus]RXI98639.1 dipeptidase PepV [Anaerobacillus alkaliphilus]